MAKPRTLADSVSAGSAFRLAELAANGTNTVGLKAPDALASDVTWKLPATDGSPGQAITTDGSGNLAFSTVSSAATPTTLGTVYGKTDSGSPYATFVGYQSGNSNTASSNVAVGYQAFYTNTSSGTGNAALGVYALFSNAGGSNNTAVGSGVQGSVFGPLHNNTTGSNNVAVGTSALYQNTTANNSTAVGYQALYGSNTIGSNTAVGAVALTSNTSGTQNVAVGGAALQLNTTGSYNSALGLFALYSNTTGAANTAVGYLALQANTTGSVNQALGYEALKLCTTGYNNTAIGYYALGVLTTGASNIAVMNQTTGGANSPVFSVTTENNRLVMGHTGITNAYVQVAWTVTSDARDKTNIQPVPHGLGFINQLSPVSFQFKTSREDDTPNGNKRYGFLAQDILALEGDDPVIIDNEVPEKLKYQGESLVPVLVKAVQELSAQVQALQAEIATLKGA